MKKTLLFSRDSKFVAVADFNAHMRRERSAGIAFAYFAFSSIATATATVIPTMGLLPISGAEEAIEKTQIQTPEHTIYVRFFVPPLLWWTKCGRECVHE